MVNSDLVLRRPRLHSMSINLSLRSIDLLSRGRCTYNTRKSWFHLVNSWWKSYGQQRSWLWRPRLHSRSIDLSLRSRPISRSIHLLENSATSLHLLSASKEIFINTPSKLDNTYEQIQDKSLWRAWRSLELPLSLLQTTISFCESLLL